MQNTNYIFYVAIIFSIYMLSSCKADQYEPTPLGSFSFTNAAPGSPAADVLVDGIVTSAARLTFGVTTVSKSGSTLRYLPVGSGDRNIKLTPDTGKTNFADLSLPFTTGGIYSFFAYDTVSPAGQVKVIRLNDDLTIPAAGTSHFRFIHLAPKASSIDVTFLNTTTGADSLTLPAQAYLGSIATPDVNALSKFTPIKAGTFTVKFKTPGTQAVLATFANITLGTGKIYSFYANGTVKNVALGIGSFANY